MVDKNVVEKMSWSMAIPGFGQLLNGKYFKGIIIIVLVLWVHVKGNLNKVILLSFHGKIEEAIQLADYQWILFFPCLYLFAMWDAYKDAGGGKAPFAFLPFVFSAYSMTLGSIYSPTLTLFGHLLGPFWLPVFSMVPGFLVGFLLQRYMRKKLTV